MKKYCYTLIITLFFLVKFANANEYQSLDQRINAAKGVPKIELLNHLADSLLTINPTKSKELSSIAFNESIKIGNDKLKVVAIYNKAYSCYFLGEYKQGIVYLDNALTINSKVNDLDFDIDALTLKGIMLKSLDQYLEANKTYNIAFELCLKSKNNYQAAMVLNNIGNVFEAQGDYESAVKNYLSALRYYNPNIDSFDIGLSYINLGKMFLNLENYNQAREFFQTALNFCTSKMLNEKAIINNCLGTIFYAQNNMEAALLLFNRALSLSDNIIDKRNLAFILNNIAEVNRVRENYTEALKYYALSQEINSKYQYNLGSANIEINLAHLYMMQKDMTNAKLKLENAQTLIDKYNFKSLKLELFEKYSKFYNIKGDLKTALQYKDEYIKLKDTISFIERNRKLNFLVAQFTMEGKDKQIEGYESEKRIMDLELTQKRILIALLVLTVFFFIALLWFFFSRNRAIAKHEKDLELKNIDLEKSYAREKEVTEMNKIIIDLISHNFRVPFTIINNSAELIKLNLNKGKFENANKNVSNITKTINDLKRFITQLVDISKNEGVKLNDDITSIDICEYLKTLVNYEFMDSLDHRHNFILNFPEKTVIAKISLVVLDHIFHNLLSNAVKYSNKDTDITIDLSVKSELLYCSIKDFGRGIPLAEQDKLFTKYHRFSNTDGVKGTGIGMYLVKRIINELNGTISVISAENAGTTVNFSFPLDTRTAEDLAEENKKEKVD